MTNPQFDLGWEPTISAEIALDRMLSVGHKVACLEKHAADTIAELAGRANYAVALTEDHNRKAMFRTLKSVGQKVDKCVEIQCNKVIGLMTEIDVQLALLEQLENPENPTISGDTGQEDIPDILFHGTIIQQYPIPNDSCIGCDDSNVEAQFSNPDCKYTGPWLPAGQYTFGPPIDCWRITPVPKYICGNFYNIKIKTWTEGECKWTETQADCDAPCNCPLKFNCCGPIHVISRCRTCPVHNGGGDDTIPTDKCGGVDKPPPPEIAGKEWKCCNNQWTLVDIGQDCPIECGGTPKPTTRTPGKEWKCCNDKWIEVDIGKPCPDYGKPPCCKSDASGTKCCDNNVNKEDVRSCNKLPDKLHARGFYHLPWKKDESGPDWVWSECGIRKYWDSIAKSESVGKLTAILDTDRPLQTVDKLIRESAGSAPFAYDPILSVCFLGQIDETQQVCFTEG